MTGRSTTLRGTGWLRESPRNLFPLEWLAVRGRSQLRKCMFLPAIGRAGDPREVAALPDTREVRQASQASQAKPWELREPRRVDPLRHARVFPAVAGIAGRPAREEPLTPRRVWGPPKPSSHAIEASVLDTPAVLGILLIMLPPVGVAAVWASPRYDRDARWALTFTSALFMALATIAMVTLAR